MLSKVVYLSEINQHPLVPSFPPPTQNLMDLLAWRFLRSHGVKAMAHWEASPFFTKDGQDVVKATGPHIVSEGWERVTAKETGGASSRGGMVASLAAPLGVVPVVGILHWIGQSFCLRSKLLKKLFWFTEAVLLEVI